MTSISRFTPPLDLIVVAPPSASEGSRFSVLAGELLPIFPEAKLPALNVTGNLPPSNFTKQIIECLGQLIGKLHFLKEKVEIKQVRAPKCITEELIGCGQELIGVANHVARLADLEEKLDYLKGKIEKQEPLTYKAIGYIQRIHEELSKKDPEATQQLNNLFHPVTALDFSHCSIIDRQLSDALEWCPNLQVLNLSSCQITDHGLQKLQACANLQELNLTNVPITDTGLLHLQALTHLQTLHLSGGKLTKDGLSKIQGAVHLQQPTILPSNSKTNISPFGDSGIFIPVTRPSPALQRSELPTLNVAGHLLTKRIAERLGHVIGEIHSFKGAMEAKKLKVTRRVAEDLIGCEQELQTIAIATARLGILEEKLDLLAEKIEKQQGLLTYEDTRYVHEIHKKLSTNDPESIPRLKDLLNKVTALAFSKCGVVDRQLSDAFEFCPNLQKLTLSGFDTINDEFWRMARLAHLQELNLLCCQITSCECKELTTLIHLRILNLSGCKITDHELQGFQAFSYLQVLNLAGCKITDAGLSHLRVLTHLQELHLSGTLSCPPRMLTLRPRFRMTHFQEPIVYFSTITDTGLAHLYALSNLRALHLSGCTVTRGGLRELKRLVHLQELTLQSCPNVEGAILLELEFANRGTAESSPHSEA